MSARRPSFIPRIAALLFGVLLLWSPAAGVYAQTDTKAAVTNRQAILIRGAARVLGLPGFAPNSFPALFGVYRIDTAGSDYVYVWATQEALYFDSKLWKARSLKTYRLLERDADPEDTEIAKLLLESNSLAFMRLIALDRPFPQSSSAGGLSEWTIIIAFSEENYDNFALVFLERFSYFLTSAKAPSDASLPAVLEF